MDSELLLELERLRGLLQGNRVREARRKVQELCQRWPDDEQVRHYAKVLAPPVARSRPDLPLRCHREEQRWLSDHAGEHEDNWLAVKGYGLFFKDPDLGVVLEYCKQNGGEDCFLHHCPPKDWDAPKVLLDQTVDWSLIEGAELCSNEIGTDQLEAWLDLRFSNGRTLRIKWYRFKVELLEEGHGSQH